jgi:demethylmenaquinone methyltransferase/2-methoxy-6-polyprenyl-1,4-benzoquinol methylase
MTLETIGRKFARFTTNLVMRRPALWRLLRGPMRTQFDAIAPRWEAMRLPDTLAPFEAALEGVGPSPPTRVLDLGTGPGAGARALAARFPEAEIVGADLSERMLEEARRVTPPEVASRVRYETADASALPYGDGAFDLVTHANMFPFVDELERVLAPGGQALFAYSSGPETPIYVPPERLRDELARRGFTDFAEFAAGRGNAFLARKPERG